MEISGLTQKLLSNNPLKIGFVGAGNVATHLAVALARMGHSIEAVCARSLQSSSKLADRVGAKALDDVALIPPGLDMVVISTTDSSVREVASKLPKTCGIVTHTSGSIPLSTLSDSHCHAAVIYPLQTFSQSCEVNLSEVPFFIEATDPDSLEFANVFARQLSKKVFKADSNLRARLHIAGVLSSNFPIYLLEIARKVLINAGLPLETVKPLVETSINKAFSSSPLEALTGPARRGDIATIKKQSQFFENSDERNIYDAVSKAILNEFHHPSTLENE